MKALLATFSWLGQWASDLQVVGETKVVSVGRLPAEVAEGGWHSHLVVVGSAVLAFALAFVLAFALAFALAFVLAFAAALVEVVVGAFLAGQLGFQIANAILQADKVG